jgi:hypothetical protein
MSIIDMYFLELFVYLEAILNANSPLLSEFSTILLTVSSVLDGFCSTKAFRHSNRDMGVYPECSEGKIQGSKPLYQVFKNLYSFKLGVHDSIIPTWTQVTTPRIHLSSGLFTVTMSRHSRKRDRVR